MLAHLRIARKASRGADALRGCGCRARYTAKFPCKRSSAALVDFATRYNETWLVARHGYRTPVEVRADQSRLDPNATANLKLAA
jgi:hypothetical protein